MDNTIDSNGICPLQWDTGQEGLSKWGQIPKSFKLIISSCHFQQGNQSKTLLPYLPFVDDVHIFQMGIDK